MKNKAILTLLSTALCANIGRAVTNTPNIIDDCEILNSAQLETNKLDALSKKITYNEAVTLPLLIEHPKHYLRVTQRNNMVSVWKGLRATDVCRSSGLEMITDDLEKEDLNIIENDNEALMTDFRIIKTKRNNETHEINVIECLTPMDTYVMEQRVCQEFIDKISPVLKVKPVQISDLQLKMGLNHMFLWKTGFSNKKPEAVICRNQDTEIQNLLEKTENGIQDMILMLKNIDQSLGTRFLESMEMEFQVCDNELISDIMNLKDFKAPVRKCIGERLAKRLKTRVKRASFIEIGGDDGATAEMTDEINKNLKLLSENEQKILKKLFSLQLQDNIEQEALAAQDSAITKIYKTALGNQQIINTRTMDAVIKQQLIASYQKTLDIIEHFNERIREQLDIISHTMTGSGRICTQLQCFSKNDVHIIKTKRGLSTFISTHHLLARDGVMPSCRMTKGNKISKFHLIHLMKINDTHYKTQMDEEVDVQCLKSYASCTKELLRPIKEDDLLDGDLLLYPGKSSEAWIQCLNPKNIQAGSNQFVRCDKSRRGVNLPLTLASGSVIGYKDLKVGLQKIQFENIPLGDSMLSLAYNKIRLQAMKELGEQMWSNLADVSKLNSHHGSAGIGIGIGMTILCLCLCCCRCCINIMRTRNPFQDDESKEAKCSNLIEMCKCWKQGDKENQEDEGNVPSAPFPVGEGWEPTSLPPNSDSDILSMEQERKATSVGGMPKYYINLSKIGAGQSSK